MPWYLAIRPHDHPNTPEILVVPDRDSGQRLIDHEPGGATWLLVEADDKDDARQVALQIWGRP
jgi:hypothetical protein